MFKIVNFFIVLLVFFSVPLAIGADNEAGMVAVALKFKKSSPLLDHSGNDVKANLTGNAKIVKRDGQDMCLKLNGGNNSKDGLLVNFTKKNSSGKLSVFFDMKLDMENFKSNKQRYFYIFSKRFKNLNENCGFTLSGSYKPKKSAFLLCFAVGTTKKNRKMWIGIPQSVNLDAWNRFEAIYDGMTMKMFINGKLIKEQKTPAGKYIEGKYSLKIGNTGRSSYLAIPGQIDNIIIVDGAARWTPETLKKFTESKKKKYRLISNFSKSAQIVCSQVYTPPVIDGELNDKLWKNAEFRSKFIDLSGGNIVPPSLDTRFALAMDDNNLYIAAECKVDELASIKPKRKERDSAVWRDESLDINIFNNEEFHKVIANNIGVIYDAKDGQDSWQSQCNVACKTGAEGWFMEMAIPLEKIGLRKRQSFKLNIGRHHYSIGGIPNQSSWLPALGSFANKQTMGQVKFDSSKPDSSILKVVNGDTLFVEPANTVKHCLMWKAGIKNPKGNKFKKSIKLLNNPKDFVIRVFRKDGTCWDIGASIDSDTNAFKLVADLKPDGSGAYYIFGKKTIVPVDLIWIPTLAGLKKDTKAQVLVSINGGKITEFELLPGKNRKNIQLPKLSESNHKLKFKVKVAKNFSFNSKLVLRRSSLRTDKQIYVDSQRRVIVNGKPIFAFGVIGVYPKRDDLKMLKAKGYDINLSYKLENPPYWTVRKMLDDAAAAGTRIIIFPYTPSIHKKIGANKIDKETIKGIKEIISTFKNHPGLLGWYLFDEPSGHGTLPETLHAVYEIISEADPNHPCILLHNNVNDIYSSGKYCDILLPDPYPLPLKKGKHQSIRPMLLYPAGFMDACVKMNKAAWMCPQLYDYSTHASGLRADTRLLTYEELRSTIYASIIHGATGIIGYTYDHLQEYPVLEVGYPAIGQEIRLIEDFILNGKTIQATTSNKNIHILAKELGGQIVVIASNMSQDKTIKAKITLPGLNKEISVLSEGRQLQVKKATISDSFEPIKTHIYTTEKYDGSNIAQTLSAIQNRKDEISKANRGNLAFHVNGGSTEEKYKLLINGLYTSPNAISSVKISSKAKIEVKLASPQEVSKILIYSGNPCYPGKYLLSNAIIQAKINGSWEDVCSVKSPTEIARLNNIPNGKVSAVRIKNNAKGIVFLKEIQVWEK